MLIIIHKNNKFIYSLLLYKLNYSIKLVRMAASCDLVGSKREETSERERELCPEGNRKKMKRFSFSAQATQQMKNILLKKPTFRFCDTDHTRFHIYIYI
uniref:Uncharacterized protein n=1 Tax=Cannabis sativa TaxID=3483 RepID=A0A803RAF3_CANSA